MRIITRDRTADVPYESCIVYTDESGVKAKLYDNTFIRLGIYTEYNTADMVVQMIRTAYSNGAKLFYMPTSGIDELFKRIVVFGQKDCYTPDDGVYSRVQE